MTDSLETMEDKNMIEYIQSEESYKGFNLKIRRFCLNSNTLMYHRECLIFKGDNSIAISKTKKEAKELIDGGYIK